MKNIWKISILFVVAFIAIGSVAYADDLKGRTCIGLGNPYISIKHGFSPKCSIEARGAFNSIIKVYGARLYHNFNPNDKVVIFIGGEGDYLSFNKDDVSGKGYVGYAFIGGEYFIAKRFSFNLDIGPAFIGLAEDKSNLSVDGIEYVVNLGINFYFK